jgi:threonine dehydratase
LSPDCRLYGVEPAAGDDGRQSLERGSIVHIPTPQTIADGAQTQHLGELTFAILQREVTAVLTASDDELVEGMRSFAARMKVVVEPTGALGLAGLRGLGDQVRGLRVGLVVSGGNVDLDRFAALLSAGA